MPNAIKVGTILYAEVKDSRRIIFGKVLDETAKRYQVCYFTARETPGGGLTPWHLPPIREQL